MEGQLTLEVPAIEFLEDEQQLNEKL